MLLSASHRTQSAHRPAADGGVAYADRGRGRRGASSVAPGAPIACRAPSCPFKLPRRAKTPRVRSTPDPVVPNACSRLQRSKAPAATPCLPRVRPAAWCGSLGHLSESVSTVAQTRTRKSRDGAVPGSRSAEACCPCRNRGALCQRRVSVGLRRACSQRPVSYVRSAVRGGVDDCFASRARERGI